MAGSVASIAVTGVCAACAVSFGLVVAAALQGQRVSATADAAALAAADAASGAIPGYPCERAAHVAGALGAEVIECDLDGLVATIAVAAGDVLRTAATARAGPPP